MHDLWDALSEPMRAALLSAAVAFLRILYDGKEPRWARRILEMILCGAIAVGVAELIEALGLPPGWGTFAGAMVGLQGADWARQLGRRVATRRLL